MDPQKPSSPASPWHFDAAIAAWLLPGLGHIYLGEFRRGAILGASIMVLWLAGFLIGGISVFDHTDNSLWFLGQDFLSPSLVADQVLQRVIKTSPGAGEPLPDQHPAYEPSFGRVSEQGILYTALAGLLNLLAILDVVYCDERFQAASSGSASAHLAPEESQGGGGA